MAKNAYFGTDTGNFGTGTAMYDTEHTSAGGQNRLVSSFQKFCSTCGVCRTYSSTAFCLVCLLRIEYELREWNGMIS